ncbi:hypothetical protein Cob_v003856 [Colletotrichum orbiculare MAFF 240422]|uniref:Uncharacterized protein n=1 Tax=Colletotrichum orbiculare (strain 104-T / ATCC 96160 / CBS 514.97 / LARS 414 / MAFF 240422) TaxID=1213857 RepID=A0A484FZJ4_COLOR|nr:hypothetical protein Cob_v003856 [Colletotrichum orbiculare MAFF 240422]
MLRINIEPDKEVKRLLMQRQPSISVVLNFQVRKTTSSSESRAEVARWPKVSQLSLTRFPWDFWGPAVISSIHAILRSSASNTLAPRQGSLAKKSQRERDTPLIQLVHAPYQEIALRNPLQSTAPATTALIHWHSDAAPFRKIPIAFFFSRCFASALLSSALWSPAILVFPPTSIACAYLKR